jgi:hypothetical protein
MYDYIFIKTILVAVENGNKGSNARRRPTFHTTRRTVDGGRLKVV